MKKKILTLGTLVAVGIGSILGIDHLSEVKAEKGNIEKEQLNLYNFKYTFANGLVINVKYDGEGGFYTVFNGQMGMNYDAATDTSTFHTFLGLESCGLPKITITDENDDNLVDTIESGYAGMDYSKESNPMLYSNTTVMLRGIKESINWKYLKKEAKQFKIPNVQKSNSIKFQTFVNECTRIYYDHCKE